MTFYEIIISRPNDRAVIIEGSENLYAARNMLHAEAEQGNIPGVSKVDIYDAFQAPADVLRRLLDHLNQDSTWLEDHSSLEVLLTEI